MKISIVLFKAEAILRRKRVPGGSPNRGNVYIQCLFLATNLTMTEICHTVQWKLYKMYLEGVSEPLNRLVFSLWEALLYELVLLLRDPASVWRGPSEEVTGGVLLRLCGGVLGGVRVCGGVPRPPPIGRFLLALLSWIGLLLPTDAFSPAIRKVCNIIQTECSTYSLADTKNWKN